MEKTSTLVNNIFSNTKEYLNLKTKSLKLEAYEKTADAVSGSVNGAALFVIGLCAFIFLNVGVAYWLSEVFMSTKLGFLVLGGFYVVVMGIYLGVKKQIGVSVKNKIVQKMSKDTIHTYELALKEKESVNNQLAHAETLVKEDIEELKENLNTLVEDIQRLKRDVARFRNIFSFKGHHDDDEVSHNGHDVEEKINGQTSRVGPKIPRMLVNGAMNFLMSRFFLKNAGSILKMVVPIVANTMVTSKLFKEKPKTSFMENLKLTLSKFL
jgi:hypothetical protein